MDDTKSTVKSSKKDWGYNQKLNSLFGGCLQLIKNIIIDETRKKRETNDNILLSCALITSIFISHYCENAKAITNASVAKRKKPHGWNFINNHSID